MIIEIIFYAYVTANRKNNFSGLWLRQALRGELPFVLSSGTPRSIPLLLVFLFESQVVSLSSGVQMTTTFLDFLLRVVP